MYRVGLSILLAVAMASIMSSVRAEVGLAKPTLGPDDPVQCHWSFLVTFVTIGETCFKERDSVEIGVIRGFRDKFEAYVIRNSDESLEAISRERASIVRMTLDGIGALPDGCEDSDLIAKVYAPYHAAFAVPDPKAQERISTFLSVDRPVRLEACEPP